jgi:hypothetical protein
MAAIGSRTSWQAVCSDDSPWSFSLRFAMLRPTWGTGGGPRFVPCRIGRRRKIDPKTLEGIAQSFTKVTKSVTVTDAIRALSQQIEDRLEEIGGPSQGLDTSLGFSPADGDRPLRAMSLRNNRCPEVSRYGFV